MNAKPAQSQLLKLRAQDREDLKLLAPYLQDAIVSVRGVIHTPHDASFALWINRFQWEKDPVTHESGVMYPRVHAGLHFSHVNQVHHQNFDHTDHAKFLSLLTCESDEEGEVLLTFSGGVTIRLHVDKIWCHMMDMSEPWYTDQKPAHPGLYQ